MRKRTKRTKSVVLDDNLSFLQIPELIFPSSSVKINISGIKSIDSEEIDLDDSADNKGQIAAAYDFQLSPEIPTFKNGIHLLINEVDDYEAMWSEIKQSDVSFTTDIEKFDYRLKVIFTATTEFIFLLLFFI